jgi:hypothetical protein
MCSQTPDHGSPEKKSVNYHKLMNGLECSDRTTHGRWLSETTKPLEKSLGIEFLKNLHQYWQECGGKGVKDPLRKML